MTFLQALLQTTEDEASARFLLEQIRDGELPASAELVCVESILSLLGRPEPEWVFLAFQCIPKLLERGVLNPRALASAPCFAQMDCDKLGHVLSQNPLVVKFPVVQTDCHGNPTQAFLSEALLFPWESPAVTTIPNSVTCPPPEATGGRGGLIVFKHHVAGNSHHLALAAALDARQTSEEAALSGTVSATGEVGPVDFWDEKKRVCEEKDLPLLGYPHVRNLREATELLHGEPVHIPALMYVHPKDPGKSLEEFLASIKTPYKPETLAYLWGIDPGDFVWHWPEMLTPEVESWWCALEHCREWLKKLTAMAKGRGVHIHLGLRMPSMMAFSIGCMLKKLANVTPYHFQNEAYSPVSGSSLSHVANPIPPHLRDETEYQMKEEDGGILVGIRFGKDAIKQDLSRLSKRTGRRLVLLDAGDSAGNLPIGNWTRVADSIADFIVASYVPGKCQLAFNLPVPLAFLVGRRIGYHKGFDLLHIEHGEYHELYNTSRLREVAF